MRPGPTVFLERSLEFQLAGVQGVAILERLDALVPMFVDDTEFKVAGRKLARFVPQQVVTPFEPPEHVIDDTADHRTRPMLRQCEVVTLPFGTRDET